MIRKQVAGARNFTYQKKTLLNSKRCPGVFHATEKKKTAINPITAGGILAAGVDFCGFQKLETAAGLVDTTSAVAGTQTVIQSGAVTQVADTYVKLGFFYDPATGLVKFYKNGVMLTSTKTVSTTAGSGFPNNVKLCPTFASVNAAAAAFTNSIDWWYAQQQPADNVN